MSSAVAVGRLVAMLVAWSGGLAFRLFDLCSYQV